MTNKQKWIIDYLKRPGNFCISVMDTPAVDEYIEKFNPKHIIFPYGPNQCRDLGRQLSKMYRVGILERTTNGINDLMGHGYPKWFYAYNLKAGGVGIEPTTNRLTADRSTTELPSIKCVADESNVYPRLQHGSHFTTLK